jgi:hypothetical protein
VHLVEILLPVADNEGQRFDARRDEEVRQALSRYHHITRAPAHGTSEVRDEIVHDDLVVFWLMVTVVRPAWLVCRPMAWSSKGPLVMASR